MRGEYTRLARDCVGLSLGTLNPYKAGSGIVSAPVKLALIRDQKDESGCSTLGFGFLGLGLGV